MIKLSSIPRLLEEVPSYVWIISIVSALFVISTLIFNKWKEVSVLRSINNNSLVSESLPTRPIVSEKMPPINPDSSTPLDHDSKQNEVEDSVFMGEGEYAGMTQAEILAEVDRKLEIFDMEHSEWKEQHSQALLAEKNLEARLAAARAALAEAIELEKQGPPLISETEFRENHDKRYPWSAKSRALFKAGITDSREHFKARHGRYPPPREAPVPESRK